MEVFSYPEPGTPESWFDAKFVGESVSGACREPFGF
jgi:hypothetical protein